MRSVAPGPGGPARDTEAHRLLDLDGMAHESEEDLWRRHLHMGIGSFVIGGLLLLCYLGLTPDDPHRRALVIVDVAAIVISVVVIGPVGTRSLTTRWRGAFFLWWSLGTIGVIAVGLGLDGGAGSPIAGLLVLPVLFGGLLYSLQAVVGLAVAALATFGLTFAFSDAGDGSRALLTAVMIGVAGGISATASMNRKIWEQELTALTERLHGLATHDGLTGCLNYQAFQGAIATEATRADRYGRPFSVVIADVDGFKAINDRYGHGEGDAALTAVVDAMLRGVRTSDLVGRIGGDEFAMLFPETASAEARGLVERIRTETPTRSTPAVVTLSFGVATWLGQGDSAEELLRRADSALYEAKRSGRNQVVVWGESTSLGATH
jgi:diguanylate cyclase (GGDEF)-like protein